MDIDGSTDRESLGLSDNPGSKDVDRLMSKISK